jgi:cytochrome c-type biogenesis protein
MAILGFLLSFTTGTSKTPTDGIIRAFVFGLGLVSSYLIIGFCLLSYKKSIPHSELLSLIISISVVIIGLNVMGILNFPLVVGNIFQDYIRKCTNNLGGIFLLGILFSFIKVPCTAPLLLVLLNKTITSGTFNEAVLLLSFSGGVLTPFIGIGLIGGYTLSKQVRSYRIYLKRISGLILIILGFWMML